MAINPYVPAIATGDGVQVDFTFTFPYIFEAHVKASLNGVPTSAFTFLSSNILRFTVAPALGVEVIISRETPGDDLAAVIQPGGPLPIVGLNRNFLQGLYYNQETQYASENQSTAGLQAQITTANNTANAANANAGAAVTTANAAAATASGVSATAAAAQSTADAAVITADAAAIAAAAAQATANAAASSNSLGLRNRIINGCFRLDQRNIFAIHNVTTTAGYTVDRWRAVTTGATATARRIDNGTSEPFRYRYRVTGAGSVTAVKVSQRIEGLSLVDIADDEGTVTVSVNTRNSLLTSMTWEARSADATDDFTSTTQVATGTWTITDDITKYEATFALTGDCSQGLEIIFSVGAQTSGNWDLAEVQLERGIIATPFESRPFPLELQLCQRYFEKSYDLDVALGTANAGGLVGGNCHFLIDGDTSFYMTPLGHSYKVTKRVVPTITYWQRSGTVSRISDYPFGNWIERTSGVTFLSNGTHGFVCRPVSNTYSAFLHFTADAEL